MAYAYADKYGFSHVTESKSIAEANARENTTVHEYSGKSENGYAVSNEGSRVAVNSPGVTRDYGNVGKSPGTEVTLSKSGAYNKYIGAAVGVGIQNPTDSQEVFLEKISRVMNKNTDQALPYNDPITHLKAGTPAPAGGPSTVYTPLTTDQLIAQYKNTYGVYPWEGAQTKDGSVAVPVQVGGSTKTNDQLYTTPGSLADLFSLPTSPGSFSLPANLSDYLVFGGLVLLVLKLFSGRGRR